MTKGITLSAIAAAFLIAGFVISSKAENVKMWDSISKGEAMEKTSYALFGGGILAGAAAAVSISKKKTPPNQ